MSPDTRTHAHRPTLVVDVGPVAHGGHCVARHEGRRGLCPPRHSRARRSGSGSPTTAPPPNSGAPMWWRSWRPPRTGCTHFWDLADSAPLLVAPAPARRRRRTRPHLAGAPAQPQGRGPGRTAQAAGRRRTAPRAVTSKPSAWRPWRGAARRRSRSAAGAASGLGWRTRAGFAVTPAGKLGMHAHRSDAILPVREMPLAVDGINALRLWDIDLQGIDRVEVAAPANGSRPLVLLVPAPGTRSKRLSGILAQLPDDVSVASLDPGHRRGAAAARPHLGPGIRGRPRLPGYRRRLLADPPRCARRRSSGAVTGFLARRRLPRAGGRGGGPLRRRRAVHGTAGRRRGRDRVRALGGRAPGTSRDARKNLHDAAQVEIVQGRVERVLRQKPRNFDALILDPPRAGAGKAVVSQLIDCRSPRRRLRLLRSGLVRPRPGLLPAGRLGHWPGCVPSTCTRTPTTWRLWRC